MFLVLKDYFLIMPTRGRFFAQSFDEMDHVINPVIYS